MKLRNLILIAVLLTLLAACKGAVRPTPTPFPEANDQSQTVTPSAPLEISIADLAAEPETHLGNYVKLTGQYRRQPLLICDADPHLAPATWQLLSEDGSRIAVGGFDSQVRSLLPNDLTVTVAGVWQQFDGLVGCGKNAARTQIWYLKASDILSPSPIARVTLTPTGSGTQIAGIEGGTAVSPTEDAAAPTITPTLAGSGEAPLGTPTSAEATTPAPIEEETPTFTQTPPPGGDDSFTATPTSDDGVAATATPTGDSAGGTPTASSGSATPTPSNGTGGAPTPTSSVLTTATRNPNNFDNVEFDDLSPEVPVLELLAAEEAHLWPVLFEYNGAITITAVAEPTMNIVLEIMGPNASVVQQANNAGPGGLEEIVNAQLNVALDYKIRIYDLNGTEGDYCLIFSEGGGFPDIIRGRIEYGQTVNGQVEVLGIDYWCFLGASGDSVSISTTATGSGGDFAIGLYGPPDFESIGSVFTSPAITNASLTENGMFIVGVLDFDAGAASYSLSLMKN